MAMGALETLAAPYNFDRRRRRAIAAAIMTLALPRVAAADTGAKSVSQPPRDHGRLFRIVKAGIPDSYVLGTIHAADPRTSEPGAQIIAALTSCRTLTVELIPQPRDPQLQELENV